LNLLDLPEPIRHLECLWREPSTQSPFLLCAERAAGIQQTMQGLPAQVRVAGFMPVEQIVKIPTFPRRRQDIVPDILILAIRLTLVNEINEK
jgi:hypothetical protein